MEVTVRVAVEGMERDGWMDGSVQWREGLTCRLRCAVLYRDDIRSCANAYSWMSYIGSDHVWEKDGVLEHGWKGVCDGLV